MVWLHLLMNPAFPIPSCTNHVSSQLVDTGRSLRCDRLRGFPRKLAVTGRWVLNESPQMIHKSIARRRNVARRGHDTAHREAASRLGRQPPGRVPPPWSPDLSGGTCHAGDQLQDFAGIPKSPRTPAPWLSTAPSPVKELTA